MKLDVLYTTYRKDLSWLCYSAQLLHKHFRSPFQTHVIANRDCEDVLRTWGLARTTYHYVDPWPDGYQFAMYQKTLADQYCDSDLIMILDSDHLLLEPVYLDDFLEQGKPKIRWRSWDSDPSDRGLAESKRQWIPPVEQLMDMPLDADYMLGPPFLFWRETFAGVRERIEDVTGLPFRDAVYSGVPYDFRRFLSHPKVYCDYEALGLYAAKFQPERYALVPYRKTDPWPFKVYWSHGDWSDSLQIELDLLLSRSLDLPFNGDRFVQSEVQALIHKHGIRTVIETGTYHGATTKALAGMAPWVITIELNDYPNGHLDSLANVTRLSGDSADLLPTILLKSGRPILFYLDAHWEKHSPLLDELQAIREGGNLRHSVIVIHDFKNPAHPEYGFDTWDIGPYTLELIEPAIHGIYGSAGCHFHFNDKAEGDCRGVVYIEPR